MFVYDYWHLTKTWPIRSFCVIFPVFSYLISMSSSVWSLITLNMCLQPLASDSSQTSFLEMRLFPYKPQKVKTEETASAGWGSAQLKILGYAASNGSRTEVAHHTHIRYRLYMTLVQVRLVRTRWCAQSSHDSFTAYNHMFCLSYKNSEWDGMPFLFNWSPNLHSKTV